MRATGAVCRLLAVALDGDGDVPLAVEEPVHGLGAVASGDDDGRGSQSDDPLGEIPAVGSVVVGDAGPARRPRGGWA